MRTIFETGLYLDYLKKKETANFISDKTANDLNFEELFEHLDHTTSKVGQQYLYSKLRSINLSDYSIKHETITTQFIEDSEFASKTEKCLKKLNTRRAYNIISLFTEELPDISKFYSSLLFTLRFIPFTFAILLFAFNLNFCIYLLLLSLVVNTVIHYLNKLTQQVFEDSIPQFSLVLKCSKSLVKEPEFNCISTGIQDSIDLLEPISKASTLFKVEKILQTDIALLAWMLAEFVRIITLSEPYRFHKTIKLIRGKQNQIEKLYCFVGEIDSLLAISKIRSSEPYYCIPSFDEANNKLAFSELYHPLIDDCISNDLSAKNKSVLLTGSNMSGKSTFIRTVGINVLLAQNINTCFAKSFSMQSRLMIDSMITVSDDLMNSKSLFFQEVLTIKNMIEHASEGGYLFLLDEIFKGTNTLERIAAAKAVLSQLNKNDNLVFVSTHDLELADLLEEEFDLYHFCEHVYDSNIDFDYLLKHGKLTDFNALKILKANGFDNELLEEAYRIIDKIDNRLLV